MSRSNVPLLLAAVLICPLVSTAQSDNTARTPSSAPQVQPDKATPPAATGTPRAPSPHLQPPGICSCKRRIPTSSVIAPTLFPL
jgi:hypothetical protein